MSMVKPDSVLARTAAELRIAHTVDPLGSDDRCQRCARPYPCEPSRAAAEVCRAAGLPEEADEQGRVPASRNAA